MAVSRTLRVIESFPEGTSVEAFVSATPLGAFPPPGEPVAKGKVDRDGNVKFTGLEDRTQYVVVGQVPAWRQVSFYTDEQVNTQGEVATVTEGTNPAAQPEGPNTITGDVQSVEASGHDPADPNVDAKPLNPGLPGEPEADPAEKQDKPKSTRSKSK